MVVGQLGLNQHVHQLVEWVIEFDRGINKTIKRKKSRAICF